MPVVSVANAASRAARIDRITQTKYREQLSELRAGIRPDQTVRGAGQLAHRFLGAARDEEAALESTSPELALNQASFDPNAKQANLPADTPAGRTAIHIACRLRRLTRRRRLRCRDSRADHTSWLLVLDDLAGDDRVYSNHAQLASEH